MKTLMRDLPFLAKVETHLVDHCNLACKGCSHYSPIAPENFTDCGIFKRDIKELAKKVKIGYLRLLGGEPLLHPRIEKFIKIARKYMPETRIDISTNGLLLPKMKKSFWATCRENSIEINLSKYPPNEKYMELYLSLIKQNGCKHGFVNDGSHLYYLINIKGDSDMHTTYEKCKIYNTTCFNLWKSKLHLCGRCYNEFLNVRFNMNLPTGGGGVLIFIVIAAVK